MNGPIYGREETKEEIIEKHLNRFANSVFYGSFKELPQFVDEYKDVFLRMFDSIYIKYLENKLIESSRR